MPSFVQKSSCYPNYYRYYCCCCCCLLAYRMEEGKGSAREYLETTGVCGIVEGALKEMLSAAINKPYQGRFDTLDYIVVYLYKHNPKFALQRQYIGSLWEIPFVQETWKETPRKDLPLSAR